MSSLKYRQELSGDQRQKPSKLPVFTEKDRGREILVPYFSRFYSPLVESALSDLGYNFTVLPPPDRQSVDIGLKYTNNEICYPAIIVVGDILKALKQGNYDPSTVAIGITQTGAQWQGE